MFGPWQLGTHSPITSNVALSGPAATQGYYYTMEPEPNVQVAQSALHQDGLFAAKQGGFQSGEVRSFPAYVVATTRAKLLICVSGMSR